MAQKPIEIPPELVRADYNIYRYTDQMYKIVRFHSTAPRFGPGPKEAHQKYDNKLEASLSRSRRVVLELALCNTWDWFCTFTISESKYDRSDLIKWRDSFTQWIRDYRKKGYEIAYVLVPEKHEKGTWHAHGFFKGNMPLVSFSEERKRGLKVPDKLVAGGYYNWPDYMQKFGFCSFGKINNPVAAGFYVTKYLTKDPKPCGNYPCSDCPFVPCFCARRNTLADCCGGYVCPECSVLSYGDLPEVDE